MQNNETIIEILKKTGSGAGKNTEGIYWICTTCCDTEGRNAAVRLLKSLDGVEDAYRGYQKPGDITHKVFRHDPGFGESAIAIQLSDANAFLQSLRQNESGLVQAFARTATQRMALQTGIE